MSELDVPQELKHRVAADWNACIDTRIDVDGAEFWAGVAKADQAMAETWHQVRRAVRPDPESVLGKLLLDAEAFRRSEVRHAKDIVARNEREATSRV